MQQAVLECVNAVSTEVPVVPYLVYISIVGKIEPAIGEFQRLCNDADVVRSMWVEPRMSTCGIYSNGKALVAAETTKLQTTRDHNSFTAVGTPLGPAE